MTLVEAFRVCGPLVGDPAEDAIRGAAAAVLYARLTTLVRRRKHQDNLEDLPATVVLRLIQKGPRPDTTYDTEDLVEWYLRRSISNGYVDRQRQCARTDQLDDGPARLTAVQADARRDSLDEDRARVSISWAVTCLFGDVAATCSRPAQAAIAIRRRVAEGRSTFDDCVREEFGEVTKQNRDALYQRQSRAMKELARAVPLFVAAHQVDQWQAAGLSIVLQELKDAEAGWPIGEEAEP